MALHLIKLCVGAESIADLEEWIAERVAAAGEHVHTTRMTPKRREEILDGGSLYWVIRGELNCRQAILDLRAVVDAEGISRCGILLDPRVVPVDPRPRGPFQGWRYFEAKDAPPDLAGPGEAADELPMELRRELRLIGLI
ncbi:DUF1489 family protein [Labrys wisconsinensis]|uniref:Lysophospholipase n=1 Tax=Labrys wisconsinensis TaxID=425677 RepID=A0ABU0JF51_9HYPH|nr:DUF1489 domain-containing protein [Labrys wisconsinensis]MDQ0472908.1 hypothetical protein [Labrys wisconsinensis]